MSNHTPGPWRVEGWMQTCDGYLVGPEIALVYGSGKEAESNALLIASAPDLLRALEELQANPNDPRAHRTALDAIKKARGEE